MLWRAGLVAAVVLAGAVVVTPATAAPVRDIALERVTARQVITGEKVTLRAKAPGALVGRRVTVQSAAASGTWVDVKSFTVRDTSPRAVSVVARGVGALRWRVLSGPVDGTRHVSNVVKSTVFRWYYLSELEPVATKRFGDGDATIGGTTYPKSVMNRDSFWWEANPWGEWNLSYRCKTFEATIGLDDQSKTGYQVGFVSYVDGAETSWGVKCLGPGTPVTSDVSSALRLRLEDQYVSGSAGSGPAEGVGVWGNARVLCSGRP